MPEMDGLEATRQIRLHAAEQPYHHRHDGQRYCRAIREECIQAGMDDYISKPVKLEILLGQAWRFGHPRSKGRIELDSNSA